EDNTSFLFFPEPADDIVSALSRHRSGLDLIDHYQFTYEEWQGRVLQPIRVGHLLFVPPWNDMKAVEEEIRMVLDPGLVFGTGLHPTTTDCLRAMDRLHKSFKWKTVLDLGTGTGILALAAVALGAEQVTAVDLNPLAVKTARNNVSLNRFDERILVREGKAEDFVNEPADLLIANIHHDVMIQLIGQRGFREKKWAIISGLMRSQARDVAGVLKENGFQVIQEWDHEMTWYTMLIKH
ncbi:MAG: 50S ribosomal protein L11 methyltransferase, partial [Deltaproteobacteria bacterium]|nr:50S ribosomal protein L11 methyltransferase [Deltaproteobacteria bacterium]